MDRDNRWERTARAWAALRRGEGRRARPRGRRSRPRTSGARPTNSSRRPSSSLPAAARGDPRRRCGRLLQFPGGPRPPADAGDGRPGVRRLRPRTGARRPPRRRSRNTRRTFRSRRLSLRSSSSGSSRKSGASVAIRNLRIAETEKYAHVTYFFNGGVEPPYPAEERLLVPSWRGGATYDLHPQMSAEEITDEVERALAGGRLPDARRQLRQRGHGRPHGQARRRPIARHRDARRVLRAARGGGRAAPARSSR